MLDKINEDYFLRYGLNIKGPSSCILSWSDFLEAAIAKDSRKACYNMFLLTFTLALAAVVHAATVKESLYIQNTKVNPDGFIVRS